MREITIQPTWARTGTHEINDRGFDLPDYDPAAPLDDLIKVRAEVQRIASLIVKRKDDLDTRLRFTLPHHEYADLAARSKWLGRHHQDALSLTSDLNRLIKSRNIAAVATVNEAGRKAARRQAEEAVMVAAIRYRRHRTPKNGEALDDAIGALCELVPWWADLRDGKVEP